MQGLKYGLSGPSCVCLEKDLVPWPPSFFCEVEVTASFPQDFNGDQKANERGVEVCFKC
jgi:hypothetical protein